MNAATQKKTVPPRNSAFDRKTTIWLVLIHAGCLLAPFTFTWQAFFLSLVLYWVIGGLGIALCFHRLLTHRSFKTPKPVEYFLTILGCLAAQRSPVFWVARHRMHHAHTENEQDPHSPRHGFLWSHMVWAMKDLRVEDENAHFQKYAPDLARDPGHRFIQKTHELYPLLLAAALFAAGGLPFLVWGFFVALTLIYHGTWMVNSLGHLWGYQNYPTGDDSRNNLLLALLAFGDGWHNNHHAYQGVAHHGHRFWEVDITYGMIRLMALLGLATEVRTMPRRALAGSRPFS
jgi:fatty-acid desaturase